MALVAYDNSDTDSDFEEVNQIENPGANSFKAELITTSKSNNIPSDVESRAGQNDNLFHLLPQPSERKPALEEDDDFLHKKETVTNAKSKTKIMVPSLSEFKDVEDMTPVNTRAKISNCKKSGLLSILPQPRNAVTSTTTSKSLIPNVLTRKPNTAVVKKKPSPTFTKAKQETKSLALDCSDDSDTEEVRNDFFSINKPVEELVDLSLDVDAKLDERQTNKQDAEISNKRSIESYFKQEESDLQSTNMETVQHSNDYEVQDNSNNNGAVLDDEAILKLCGARGKRKREDIQIVDINQQEVLADAREWLLKGLMDDTTKRVSSSKKRGDEPTSQQRRKHQITYLAHQAKANEAELQNQWANNRMSKRQTQSKYGF